MTIDDALRFLRSHQPMSAEASKDNKVIAELNRVREFLVGSPDERAVPLLLNVFGPGDGFGVYQVLDEALRPYPNSLVTRHIRDGLSSDICSVRTWCAEMGCSFPDVSYEPFLMRMCDSEDEDERSAAETCLIAISSM